MRLSVRNSVSFIFLIFFSIHIQAQEKNSPAAFELLQSKKLWHQTSNASGSLIDNPSKYSVLDAGYLFYNGDFHRPQQGQSGSETSVYTEGAVLLKKIYMWGSFKYVHENVHGANFNTSVIDPYRGMPYIVADTNASDWLKQHYDLRFRVANITDSKISFGIDGNYKASIGAKQRDIRAKNMFFYLNLKPGIRYSPDQNNHIGLNGEFYSIKEESYNSNVNTYVDQEYYELYGLGTAVQGIGSGRTTNYFGHSLGGGIQYNHTGKINLMAEATFASKTEYVELSFSVPKPDAEVNDTRINGKVSMFTTTPANYTHFVTLHVSNTSIDGIQNVTKFENAIDIRKWVIVSSSKRSSFKTMLADIQYDIVKEKGKEYSWKAGIGGTFSSVNDTYLIPYSYKKAQNATFNIYGKKNIFLSEKLVRRLLFGVDIAYNMNLSGGYQYTGQHQDYPVVDNLERRDLEYLMSGYQAAGLTAIYSQKIKAGSETNLFVKANFKYINTTDFNFNNRYYGQISIGSNF